MARGFFCLVAHSGRTNSLMCGILMVRSRDTIPLEKHLSALKQLQSRGPDFETYQYKNNIFIGQTVLHITGTQEFYHTPHENFLAYNGEIYNYRELGNYRNDIEFVHDAVENDLSWFRQAQGAWAWVWTNGQSILYASDPQGERCLYKYQDNDILIVCSEVAPILEYKNLGLEIHSYQERHWAIHNQTPWQGIKRITPGLLFDSEGMVFKIDSIFDWKSPVDYQDLDQAVEHFDTVLSKVIKDMIPDQPFGITFSGGLDTACLFAKLSQAQHLYTVNIKGKDRVSTQVCDFLTDNQQTRLVKFDMDEPTWAQEFIEVIKQTRMPVQSWSFVGQWHIARHCQERILFTGVGADELFGGYEIYQTLDYTSSHSVSPYSFFDRDDPEKIELWNQCLNFYNGDAAPATLLMDYFTQVVAVDMRGVDSCTMAHGIEPRSPFVHPSMIKFALNLPWHYRVGTTAKPIIQQQFLKTWSADLIYPKQGFTGHCNDSYNWLDIDITRSQDRMQDWKNISQAGFTRWCN
jgi:asparagine synthase (glutamine-hydrolysing)